MGSSTVRASIVALALAAMAGALPPTAEARPPSAHPADAVAARRQPVPEDRYALAGGCYAVQSLADGRFVTALPDGFAATGARRDAEPFHLQATALGRYLLWSSAERFVAISPATLPGGRSVEAATSPSPAADWTIAADGPDPDAVRPSAFTVTLPDRDLALAVGPGGELRAVPAADAGVAGRFRFHRVDGCASWPEVELGVSGTPAGGDHPADEVRGLVDAHMHGMAFEFLGGRAHCGRPWHPYGVTSALVDCPDHAADGSGAVLENFLRTGSPVGNHDPVGWPTFRDWPAHDSLTHEGFYVRWLERAWRGGLRLYVNLLVENTALCQAYPLKRNSCNEMDSVRLQAQRIHELQDYVDAQSGGPGEGWFRIVTDPFEARRVINEGRLAVVLGIEVSEVFDCGEHLDVPACDEGDIDARLDEVYGLGVRQMELVNKFDNALSGVAGDGGTTGVVVNLANRYETGHWWDMRTCPDGHDHVHGAVDNRQYNLADDGFGSLPFEGTDGARDVLAGAVLAAFGSTTAGAVAPAYGPGPHCNQRGLTDLGAHAIEGLLQRGMIFDPDHMSAAARQDALDVVEAHDGGRGYSGVVSSHSWSTADAIPRIYALGGFVTPYAGGSAGFVGEWARTKDLALAHAPAEGYLFGFGYGADMNGFGSQGGPRNPDEAGDVDYPFAGPLGDVVVDRQVSGERVYDVNVDGVAHYGLYPDWVQDLRVIAGPRGDELAADMVRGAEAYLQMWERATGVAPTDCRDQSSLNDEDLHALLGDDPEAVLRTLGQPTEREDGVLRYCGRGTAVEVRLDDNGTEVVAVEERPAATGDGPVRLADVAGGATQAPHAGHVHDDSHAHPGDAEAAAPAAPRERRVGGRAAASTSSAGPAWALVVAAVGAITAGAVVVRRRLRSRTQPT